MAGVCSRVLKSCRMFAPYAGTTFCPSTCLQHSLSITSWEIHNRTALSLQGLLGPGTFCRHLSSTFYSTRRSRPLASCIQAPYPALRHTLFSMQPPTCVALSLVPVRTVVKHSKLGKMKTVKAVAKRFRRTGSGKLKYWPPGNVHNLLSKSHGFKCRVRKPRYVNKTQLKTLNKMLNGRYS